MPRKSLLIVLLLGAGSVASSSHALAFGTCEALFGMEKSSAFVYSYQDPVERLRHADSVELGEGVYGKVLLERDPFNAVRLQARKTYGTRRGANVQAQADAYLLGQLRRIRQSVPGPGFEIAQMDISITTEPGGSTVAAGIGPFIPGRTVHDLMTDPAVDPKIKATIAEIYSDYIVRLADAIRQSKADDGSLAEKVPDASIYFKDQRPDGLPALFGHFAHVGRLGRYIIKSDNVQVDPLNLHSMSVIDPY